MKAGGAINIQAGSTLNLRGAGNVLADGPEIHLNEGLAQEANPDIGNSESTYGNTGVTTYS